VNEATGAAAPRLMVTLWLVEPLPAALVAVRVTVNVPEDLKECCGFWSVEVPPSPKFQDHEVGELADVSVKFIELLQVWQAGAHVKDAAGMLTLPSVMMTTWLVEPLPEAFVAVNVTVKWAEDLKECCGF